ncbi:hypothetical protein N7532_011016 [Penicillium argentinense]|uniref:J domain-containing protein n=1 Tax=Penicillium argentinense TaxID=1131581 RepID=A0A9W9JUC9_9EURO|nr:uncharacterized protein N7532_011016 [Penicillium argentinense]KAJ5081973.1 hypothetical protein N7532_011016 [Penicillium argentinense]
MAPLRPTVFTFKSFFAPGLAKPHTLTSFHSIVSHGARTRAQQAPRPLLALPTTFKSAFSSTSIRSEWERNYYEILGVPVTATAAEIKGKFYRLSMTHHPDRNPGDQAAGRRFASISAAWNVLGDAEKRAAYDRENGFHRTQFAHNSPPSGSHSSHSAGVPKGGSYAGSRPASGLSKRRGTFTGPPPSFYAQGGYGGTGRTTPEGSFDSAFGFGNVAGGGGFGQAKAGFEDPEDPEGFIRRNPLHYFNARGHFRTQQAEDSRRGQRRSEAQQAAMRQRQAEGGSASPINNILGYLVFAWITLFVIWLEEKLRDRRDKKRLQKEVVGGHKLHKA